jgi:hypothetical protein
MGAAAFTGPIPDSLDQGEAGPGFPVEVFNVLGAGDGFMSGLIKGWLEGEPWPVTLTYANACGAFAVSRHGCTPAYPSLEELQFFLKRGVKVPALRKDATLEQMHWSTNRTRDWSDMRVFAFDHRQQLEAERLIGHDPEYFGKLAFRVAQTIGQWRLKNHAVTPFWRWVSSWARAMRMPSDLGFSDEGFILPPLEEHDHIIKPSEPPPGMLFCVPSIGLGSEREERKRTLTERCEYAAKLVDHDRPAVVWCHMNDEGDELERIIPGARQVAGKTPDDEKIELYNAFESGELRVLVIKPKIGAWGLNWQHCNHVVQFASHSFEQTYQATRRCWRFGQTRPVRLDVIATEGESMVLANMRRKAGQAAQMFDAMIREMNNSTRIDRVNDYTNKMEIPSWL